MNKYTEAIQGDDVVILCDGIPMGVGEILAALNAATPPADASLTDGINEFLTRVQNYATEDAVREFPMTAIAHINGLIGIIRKQAAALRARPQVVAEGFVDAHELLRRIYNTPTRAEKLGGQTFKYVKLCEVIDEIESLSGPPGYAQEGNPDVSSSRRDGAT